MPRGPREEPAVRLDLRQSGYSDSGRASCPPGRPISPQAADCAASKWRAIAAAGSRAAAEPSAGWSQDCLWPARPPADGTRPPVCRGRGRLPEPDKQSCRPRLHKHARDHRSFPDRSGSLEETMRPVGPGDRVAFDAFQQAVHDGVLARKRRQTGCGRHEKPVIRGGRYDIGRMHEFQRNHAAAAAKKIVGGHPCVSRSRQSSRASWRWPRNVRRNVERVGGSDNRIETSRRRAKRLRQPPGSPKWRLAPRSRPCPARPRSTARTAWTACITGMPTRSSPVMSAIRVMPSASRIAISARAPRPGRPRTLKPLGHRVAGHRASLGRLIPASGSTINARPVQAPLRPLDPVAIAPRRVGRETQRHQRVIGAEQDRHGVLLGGNRKAAFQRARLRAPP